MLDPEGRHLLLDALRPPLGYELDLAVGTTYTLDLYALLTAPVAFAMFDRESEDGSPRSDPIAALQALRRYAGRITVFCQAGDITVPRDYRSLIVYLEDSIVPVVPPVRDAIFHPKVWFIRYRQPSSEAVAYRMLSMSRNLTYDRSWDTILRLEGEMTDAVHHAELRQFVAALPGLADGFKPIAERRRADIFALADDIQNVKWTGPDGMEVKRFWPIGHDGRPSWPYGGRADRIFAISPFVTQGALTRLTKGLRGSILLSRPETLDILGGTATSHLRERLVLSSDTAETTSEEADATAGLEPARGVLQGLHAKLVVADVPYEGRVWTGSANLTDAAFNGNVEFVTELRGPKKRCGIDAIIGDQAGRLGLRTIVEPYEPASAEGRALTDLEQLARRLDAARRILGRLRFTATCHQVEADAYVIEVSGTPFEGADFDFTGLQGLAATIRPVTLGHGAAMAIELMPSGLTARYRLSYAAITPFFAIHLRPTDGETALETNFLVNAELVGAPDDRAENVMVGLLKNRNDLIRFLLLLLGNVDDALTAMTGEGAGSWEGGGSWATGPASEALLEPLMRAYSRDRTRLHEIKHVMEELAKTDTGREILPDGWDAVWAPIQAALERESRP